MGRTRVVRHLRRVDQRSVHVAPSNCILPRRCHKACHTVRTLSEGRQGISDYKRITTVLIENVPSVKVIIIGVSTRLAGSCMGRCRAISDDRRSQRRSVIQLPIHRKSRHGDGTACAGASVIRGDGDRSRTNALRGDGGRKSVSGNRCNGSLAALPSHGRIVCIIRPYGSRQVQGISPPKEGCACLIQGDRADHLLNRYGTGLCKSTVLCLYGDLRSSHAPCGKSGREAVPINGYNGAVIRTPGYVLVRRAAGIDGCR